MTTCYGADVEKTTRRRFRPITDAERERIAAVQARYLRAVEEKKVAQDERNDLFRELYAEGVRPQIMATLTDLDRTLVARLCRPGQLEQS